MYNAPIRGLLWELWEHYCYEACVYQAPYRDLNLREQSCATMQLYSCTTTCCVL